jgi:gliding motility-associated-like protein
MTKFRLLFFAFFLSFSAYSQFPNPGVEGFENTTGPDLPASPSLWTLGTGVPGNQWAVFDTGVGSASRWGINTTTVCNGLNTAYMNRANTGGAGLTSEHYLATPRVTVPVNGQLRFVSRTFTAGNTGTFYDVKWAPGTANQMDPAAYTVTLATYTEDQLTMDSYTGLQNNFDVCTTKIINFPVGIPSGTQGYVAFIRRNTQLGTAADGDRWLLDDVQLNSRCLDPTTLGTAGVFSTSANLTWVNTSGATSWEIEVLPIATATTGIGVPYNGAPPYLATTTSYGTAPLTLPLIQTPLTPNTAYKYYVRAVCPGSIPSNWVGPFNFTTTTAPPVCGGNFYDAGGPTANYPNNSNATNGTTVICPTNANELVTITFTAFNTQLNTDILSIYDGNSSSAPLLGSFSGTAIPPSFTSSAVGGCLTFVFISNGLTNAAGWAANITCAPPPVCQKPTALVTSTLLSTSVSLGWTAVGVGTGWQVLAQPCALPAPNATTTGWVVATSNPFVITGLSPATCYNLYVRSDCSSTLNGLSLWSNPVSVTTQIAPPICGGNFVDTGGTTANYGNNANITTTICPINPGEKVTVTFSIFNTQANSDGLYVYNGSTVTPTALLPSANGAGTVPGGLAGSYWGNLTGVNIPGPFTSTAADGCLTFVFRSDGLTTSPGWVSSITCALPPACQQPTNLTATLATTTTVQLGWVSPGTATSWQVIALAAGSPPPTAGQLGWTPAPTNPFVLGGLTPGTAYDYYVRGDCGLAGVSLWSGPRAFTTIPTCPAQTALTVTTVLATSVQLNWTSVAPSTSWQVIALPCGSPAPTAGQLGWTPAPTNPFVLTGLTAATCYNFYVRGVCSPTDISFWSPLATATTQALPPICGGTFTDPGGIAGNYANSTNSTVTICPTVIGEQVTVTFTLFNTENNFDGLYVYNGSTVTPAALLPSANPGGAVPGGLAGSYWGNLTGANLPGPFTSAAPDGCLTFVFITDPSVNNPGWIANITCGPPPTCAKPINLTAIVNSSTSATLNWVQPPNAGGGTATQWQVIVQPAGGPIPNNLTPLTAGVLVSTLTPAPPYTVTGLTPGTTYEFYVRAICSPTDSSPWGGPRTFFTQTSCGDSLPFCGNTGLTYTNTTGAPSYGNIDCLGTTPNPAWYFMQVNQSGTLTFQIAQTSTATGNGIDVDFVCWGPFTPAQYATLCNNLYDYPDGNTGIPDNVVGCSYSAAPIENFTITGAVSGNYYMVLITNFSNQAGTVTFTQTNNGQSGSGTTNCAIVCSVALGNDVVLCSNVTSHTITATTQGATSYAWYFNGSTTPIPGQTSSTLVVTQTGTYTCTIQCGLNNSSDTVLVTFGSAPAATISYAASPYCKSITTPQNVTFTGTTGGTYSASPIGLVINSTTGAISPSASFPGIYTVTYTIVQTGGCPTYTTTAPVEILDAVISSFTQVPPICPGDALAPLPTTSLNGVLGTWSPALNNMATTIYTFTPNPGVCALTATMTITVGSTTPTFTQVAPICPGDALAALPTTSLNGVTGTWSPALNNTATTIYTFTPTPGVCAVLVTMTIVVNEAPIVTVNSSSICTGNTATVTATPAVAGNYNYVWTVPAGVTNPGNVASFNTTVAGNYSVVISLVNTNTLCNGSFEQPTATGAFPNLINQNLVPCWKTTAADGIIEIWPTGFEAAPYAGNQLIEMNGNSVANIYQDFIVNPGTTLDITFAHRGRQGNDAVRVEIGPAAGPFVTLGNFTDGNTAWVLHTVNHVIPASDSPNYRLRFVSVSAAGGSPSVGNLLDAISVNVLTGCPSLPVTGTVTVNPFTTATFNPIANICQGLPAPSLPAVSTNTPAITGTWSPNAIDTSVVGTVVYTFTPDAGQCASGNTLSVTIDPPSIVPTFNAIANMCQGANAPALPTSSTNTTAIIGTWSPSTISTATAGTTTYTFTPAAGQCAVGRTIQITIHPTPVVSPVTNVDACDSYTLPALLVGNYFAQPGGVAPITNLTLTSNQLVYVYAQSGTTPNCTDQKSFQVNITPSPQFTLEGECIGSVFILQVTNASFNLDTANYNWSGPSVPNNGVPAIQITEAGIYTCVVSVSNGSGPSCSTTHTFNANDIGCQIPKGISPNNDGLNDTFDLAGFNVAKLSIFNRYGTSVYTKASYTDEWGGQSNSGNELADGTYYYVIELNNGGETKTGWVYINREN